MTQTKLSKQEKAILEILQRMEGVAYRRHVSRVVADQFNKGHNDRIWDRHQMKTQQTEELKRLKESGSMEEYARELTIARLSFSIVDAAHKQDRILTAKHRASFSRSLRRLQKRGLIQMGAASHMIYLRDPDTPRPDLNAIAQEILSCTPTTSAGAQELTIDAIKKHRLEEEEAIHLAQQVKEGLSSSRDAPPGSDGL